MRPDRVASELSPDRRFKVATAVAALLLVALVVRTVDPFGWFTTEPPERPAVAGEPTLVAIRDTAELKVASGTFSVPVEVDVEKPGLRSIVPDFVDGERIVAIYQADVDATIDLRVLTEESVEADPQTRTITLRVPPPRLSRPAIDPEHSNIVSHNRGVLQRVEDAFGGGSLAVKEELDAAAVAAIASAAQESDLPATARTNGKQFLTLMCRQLGYEDVTVEYTGAPG